MSRASFVQSWRLQHPCKPRQNKPSRSFIEPLPNHCRTFAIGSMLQQYYKHFCKSATFLQHVVWYISADPCSRVKSEWLQLSINCVKPMSDDTRVTITLSTRAHAEMSLVAEEKGISLSKHLGQIIEQTHETPSYGNLVRRARCWLKGEVFEGNYKG